jgi:hypothetical protein
MRMYRQLKLTAKTAIPNTTANGAQNGAKTHHQLHVMVPTSLRTIKIRPKIVNNGKLFL